MYSFIERVNIVGKYLWMQYNHCNTIYNTLFSSQTNQSYSYTFGNNLWECLCVQSNQLVLLWNTIHNCITNVFCFYYVIRTGIRIQTRQ